MTAGSDEGDRKGDPEGQRSPGQDEPHRDGTDDGGANSDAHREQRAQIEVLQRVDVVDCPCEQVATAPSGQGGGHAGRQPVVEPDAPSGECPQGGVVADQAFGVAQRTA